MPIELEQTPCRWGTKTLWNISGGAKLTDQQVLEVLQRYVMGRSAVDVRNILDEPRIWLEDEVDDLTRVQMDLAFDQKIAA